MSVWLDFVLDTRRQDFAEYALIMGAIAVVALAVIVSYRDELQAAFEIAIDSLRTARGW